MSDWTLEELQREVGTVLVENGLIKRRMSEHEAAEIQRALDSMLAARPASERGTVEIAEAVAYVLHAERCQLNSIDLIICRPGDGVERVDEYWNDGYTHGFNWHLRDIYWFRHGSWRYDGEDAYALRAENRWCRKLWIWVATRTRVTPIA